MKEEVEQTFGINRSPIKDEAAFSPAKVKVEKNLVESETVTMRQAELQAETEDHVSKNKYSDVLLIVTGGTLCMVQTENGY